MGSIISNMFTSSGLVNYSSLPSYHWTIEDVSTWLGQLGLQKYIDIFATNQVDGKVLLVIQKSDLKIRF